MLKKIFSALLVIIAIFFFIVTMQPADFRIARSTTVAAPAEAVFAQVNDFHKWDAWSPWAKLDPAMKKDFGGAPAGIGAIYTWSGNDKVGAGRMIITDSKPNELVRLQLEFTEPFAATNTAEFTMKPEGNQTTVTWSMSGTKNFMSKAFDLIMNMDKMVGGDFEKGLAKLKTVAEAAPKS